MLSIDIKREYKDYFYAIAVLYKELTRASLNGDWDDAHTHIVNVLNGATGGSGDVMDLTTAVDEVARAKNDIKAYKDYYEDVKKWYCSNLKEFVTNGPKCRWFTGVMSTDEFRNKWVIDYMYGDEFDQDMLNQMKRETERAMKNGN
ncbi:hypothetical protein [Campylobacter sp. MIT 97-5078]|uniref:hypothetical protein n=1 Tax=Campylobacter sp. MIT 97-5078 TaxID=1548153 RepID=UPI00051373FB|nr:hypothetical protein [Campylobacter sp. MIT 97-5078]KGI55984.1 hypothetical protein LR59_09430 [Campylobacter sp. MIT 97-5078]KGI57446.1 hypothetical protein LR59_01710 [Campylobacter sp. MIT 97-5078]KGI57526.1 hypothetical protein LR59_02190 [Campylobacter sp. MIT 97-5078]TQR27370.1 hypothetical protein DMB91_03685 [Campylobacter sp. MIT 97-5078]